jgi:3-methylcrotonyl-CoA carboxylase alpha subunit
LDLFDAPLMFDSLLIANRGEIACRIIRTAKRLGIHTVAVYSDADRDAMHVTLADEAFRLGPAPAAESYLNIPRLIDIAGAAGIDAVHPGYGFLAENPQFAEACQQAGIDFVGPPAAAIRAMGSKSAALDLMSNAGVPVLPGYRGDDQSDEAFRQAAQSIGFPIVVKPVAGGGGKGMRIVEDAAGLDVALVSARREAAAAFGDDNLLLERYLKRARHVEVQIFADRHGNTVHLFERDCSIQRRHQKVMEEAPAPGLSDALRSRMGAVAVRAAQAIGYTGAGTVEFLLQTDAVDDASPAFLPFYFMEMNTRLQVEHPVTEMILGLDLVEWQLKVASGEPLPETSAQLRPWGHAIEARIYAEDPTRAFLPATGRLHHLRVPAGQAGVRVDTGVREGDQISVHYDPLIAKLIAHGADRQEALRRLRGALGNYEILGVANNIALLSRIAAHPAYAEGRLDTAFIERFQKDLQKQSETQAEDARDAALAAVSYLSLDEGGRGTERSAHSYSPWDRLRGFRLNADAADGLRLNAGGEEQSYLIKRSRNGLMIEHEGASWRVSAGIDPDGMLNADIGERHFRARVIRVEDVVHVWMKGRAHAFAVVDPDRRQAASRTAQGHLMAPMPGRIIAVLVEAGTSVVRGQALLTMEAMKMEHTVAAPFDGIVEALRYGVGDLVAEGADLIHITAKPDSGSSQTN